MQTNRRHFIETLVATGTLSATLGIPGIEKALAQASPQKAVKLAGGGNSFAFWSNYYAPGKRGKIPGADEDRRVSYLHYKSAEHKLRFSHEIQPEELYPDPGDVAIGMSVTGMRLSQKDRDKFKSIQSAQLRLDLAQENKMFDILDRLAWASVAALYIRERRMPPLQDLTFTSESTNKMILPGGSGLLGVNVSMAHPESRLYQVFQFIVKEVGRFAPVVALPAISLTALNEFNRFYGAIEHRTTFLFQTTAPQRVFATQPARQNAETGAGINLVSGDYVLVPEEYREEFESHLSDFELVSGYLVPHGAEKTGHSLYSLADNIKPDVSYVALNVKVSPPWQISPRSSSAPDLPLSEKATEKKDSGKAPDNKKPQSKPKPPH